MVITIGLGLRQTWGSTVSRSSFRFSFFSLFSFFSWSHSFLLFPSVILFDLLFFLPVLSQSLARKSRKAAKRTFCLSSVSQRLVCFNSLSIVRVWYLRFCHSFQNLLFLFQKTQKWQRLYELRLDAVYDLRSFLVLFWMTLLLWIGLGHVSNLSLSMEKVKNNNTNIFLLLNSLCLSDRNRNK